MRSDVLSGAAGLVGSCVCGLPLAGRFSGEAGKEEVSRAWRQQKRGVGAASGIQVPVPAGHFHCHLRSPVPLSFPLCERFQVSLWGDLSLL